MPQRRRRESPRVRSARTLHRDGAARPRTKAKHHLKVFVWPTWFGLSLVPGRSGAAGPELAHDLGSATRTTREFNRAPDYVSRIGQYVHAHVAQGTWPYCVPNRRSARVGETRHCRRRNTYRWVARYALGRQVLLLRVASTAWRLVSLLILSECEQQGGEDHRADAALAPERPLR